MWKHCSHVMLMYAKVWEYRYVTKSGWQLSGEESLELNGIYRKQESLKVCFLMCSEYDILEIFQNESRHF